MAALPRMLSRDTFSKKVTYESLFLILICVLDLLVTVWLIRSGSATEGNPILKFYLDWSLGTFIAAKLFLSIGPIAALEMLRRQSPGFVLGVLRAGIALYLAVYVVGVLHIN